MALNRLVDEIYRTKVVRDSAGQEYRLEGQIDPTEGEFINKLISADESVIKTLEIGCAYGLSSLHICEALRERPGAWHIIVDPFEMTDWHGVGIANLKRAGVDFFELISEPSEFALPELLRKQPASMDLVFIDGWHTFDHTVLELFYANRLLRVGGYIVLDDANWPSVSAALSYFQNYPAYERVKRPAVKAHNWRQRLGPLAVMAFPPAVARHIMPASIFTKFYRSASFLSMTAFKKVSEDNRDWRWFVSF